jgi:hypothetical protein
MRLGCAVLLRLSCWIAMCALGCGQQSADSMQAYWTSFREAVARGDREAVAALTRFPLELKGPDDSQAVLTCDREQFLGVVYDAIMNQGEFLEIDGKLVERPQREWILEKTQIEPRDQLRDDVFIYSLEFSQSSGEWQLIRAHLNELPELGSAAGASSSVRPRPSRAALADASAAAKP